MLTQMMAVAESDVKSEEVKACEMVNDSFSRIGEVAKGVVQSNIESQRSSF